MGEAMRRQRIRRGWGVVVLEPAGIGRMRGILDRGGGSCDGHEQPEETGRVREQLSRNSVLRSGGNSELDSCRRWRADAQAGVLLNIFGCLSSREGRWSSEDFGNYGTW